MAAAGSTVLSSESGSMIMLISGAGPSVVSRFSLDNCHPAHPSNESIIGCIFKLSKRGGLVHDQIGICGGSRIDVKTGC